MAHPTTTAVRSATSSTAASVGRFHMTSAAATTAMRAASSTAMRGFEVSSTTAAARGFECSRLLLVLTLERLHFLRMLTL